MFRIDDPTAAAALPTPEAAGTGGYFTEGSPGVAPATTVRASWLNMVQEELAAVVTAPGLALDKTNRSQLLAALRSLFEGNIQVFTASGTFTVPAGVTKARATVLGGGGGGGGTGTANTGGGGGGAGGCAIKLITVTPGQTISVTVGSGGTGTSGNGNAGSSSSFGAFCSATGGQGGVPFSLSPAGGAPGAGTGGDLNLAGAHGGDGGINTGVGGNGGVPPMLGGSAGRGGLNAGLAAAGYGGGGGGGYLTSAGTATGGNGAPGIVIVEW